MDDFYGADKRLPPAVAGDEGVFAGCGIREPLLLPVMQFVAKSGAGKVGGVEQAASPIDGGLCGSYNNSPAFRRAASSSISPAS